MFITKTELKLYFNKGVIVCAALLALLSSTAGLLGDRLLYGDRLISDFTLYVSDNDNSIESRMLVEALKSFKTETMSVATGSEDEARKAVETGAAAAALIIPEGFFADIMSGVNSGATVYVNGRNGALSEMIRLFAESLKEQLSASQAGIYYILSEAPDDSAYIKYMNEANIIFLSVFMNRTMESETLSLFGTLSNKDYYIFCFYVFAMFILPGLLIENGGRVKKDGMLALLLSKGVSIGAIFVYKLLSIMIVYAALNIPLAVMMLASGVLSGIGAIGVLALFALLTIIQSAFCCLYIWLFNDIKTAGVCIFVVELAMLFFSGGILPLVFLPDAIRAFCRITPNYYLSGLFISLKTGAVGNENVVMIIAASVLAIAIAYISACIIVKKECAA